MHVYMHVCVYIYTHTHTSTNTNTRQIHVCTCSNSYILHIVDTSLVLPTFKGETPGTLFYIYNIPALIWRTVYKCVDWYSVFVHLYTVLSCICLHLHIKRYINGRKHNFSIHTRVCARVQLEIWMCAYRQLSKVWRDCQDSFQAHPARCLDQTLPRSCHVRSCHGHWFPEP